MPDLCSSANCNYRIEPAREWFKSLVVITVTALSLQHLNSLNRNGTTAVISENGPFKALHTSVQRAIAGSPMVHLSLT
jgi:hypothetical protein